MRIQPKIEGVGSLCVREDLDPIAGHCALGLTERLDAVRAICVLECIAAQARRHPLSFPPDGAAWTEQWTQLVEGGLGEPNMTDCRVRCTAHSHATPAAVRARTSLAFSPRAMPSTVLASLCLGFIPRCLITVAALRCFVWSVLGAALFRLE
eukprot:408065-Rhodomonas_salina.1